MPALSNYGFETQLQRREWKQTVGQSGMTPTAFAFLIPVFVVVVFAPFLCVFCIRKRQRTTALPPRKPAKKPALRRAEARERLRQVTAVSDVTDAGGSPEQQHGATFDEGETAQVDAAEREQAQADATAHEQAQPTAPAQVDSSSIRERECAICLSTLHAPSPPEPVLLASQPTVDEAAIRPPTATNPTTTSETSTTESPDEPEAILKLQSCGHEFHSECLVSWFVLRKTTCPICRAAYISKEDMKAYEDEEAAIGLAAQETTTTNATTSTPEVVPEQSRTSNWRYFWRGESVWTRNRVGSGEANGAGSATAADGSAARQQEDVEMARWTYFARTRR